MMTEIISLFTHIDDGAVMFKNRDDAIKGCNMICNIMAKWGLTVHVGRDGKKSKTEAMLILSTNEIKEWRQQKKHLKVASMWWRKQEVEY